jgi:hypothetical protein
MENNINGKQTKFKNVIKFHNIEAANLNNELPMLNKTLVGQKIAEPNAFPALYKHENGKVLYYQGAREVGPMTQWVMGSPKKNTTKRRRTRGGKHSDRKHSDRKHSDRKHSDTRGKHSDTRGKHSDTRNTIYLLILKHTQNMRWATSPFIKITSRVFQKVKSNM